MMAGCILCVFIAAFDAQRASGLDPAIILEKLIPGKLGGEANLTCDGITDYRNAVLSFNGTRRIVEKAGKYHQQPNGAFVIKNIQASDTGVYSYAIKSQGNLDYCILKLQITEETMTVKPGSTASMCCKVPEAPTVEKWSEVTWRRKYSLKTVIIVKNGSVSELARQNFSGRISASGKKLEIRNADQGDSGKYICIVEFKGNSPRGRYFINLIVSMSATIKPTDMAEVKTSDKSSISTSYPTSSTTKSEKTRKSNATTLAFSLRLTVAILILLPLLV